MRTEDTYQDRREDELNADRTDKSAPGAHAAPTAQTHQTDQTERDVESPANGQEAPLELFGPDEVTRFRTKWSEVQARFVDDPREAVHGADQLVSEVMGSLATTFTSHKHELEGQWQHGSEAQTEELRQALRRYRVFFDQLLNA